jgi:hypothetical protein
MKNSAKLNPVIEKLYTPGNPMSEFQRKNESRCAELTIRRERGKVQGRPVNEASRKNKGQRATNNRKTQAVTFFWFI